jgi:hypothetical protein
MKNKINMTSLLVLFLSVTVAFGFMACSDNNSSGGQPEITGVKILSSDTTNYSYDEFYTKAGPGTMLAVMGKNLGGALHVFINNQEVSFNTTMNTDHSLIVTVPTEVNGFKLSAFDSSIPDEIRIETGGGTATYGFKITAPGPQMQRIQAIYPRETGNEINIFGLNLVDIEEAFFSDVTAEELATTEWTEIGGNHVAVNGIQTVLMDHHLNTTTNSYETTSQLKFQMPDLPYETGVLVLKCTAGTSYLPFYKRPGQPTITFVSSDMPQIGEDLIIRGSEYVQVESIKYGDVTLTADDFTVNDEENEIVVPFTRKPTDGSGTTLTVTTPGGVVSVERFYDYSTILTTFDGDATDNGWGPNCTYGNDGTADGIYAHFDIPVEYQQWWGTMIYYRKDWSGNSFSMSPNIPATATADEVYFAINVYNDGSDYNNGVFTGYIRYMFQPIGDAENQYDNGFEWEDYDTQTPKFARPVLADINDEAPTGKWYRHVLPLSSFACYTGKSYSEIVATGLNQFRLQSINQGTPSGKINVKFDNARIIYIPSSK